MSRLRYWLPALTIACLWAQSASAHFLWLLAEPEGTPKKVHVYFGEEAAPDDPDLLDRVVKAEGWIVGGGMGRRPSEPKALTFKKGEDSLEADLPEGAASAVILRHTYGVMERGGETFLLKYLAKTYPTAMPGSWKAVKDNERLPLEVTPRLDGKSVLFEVRWKGEAVAGSTVTIVGPGIEKKLEGFTDEAGVFKAELPEAGLYSIRAKHVDATEGELDGKAYKSTRYYSTLSLRFAPAQVQASAHKVPAIPNGVTSFGGAVLGDALYVYGGNYGGAHQYSIEDQSGDLWKIDLKNPIKWEQLPGSSKLQGLAMVPYKGKLYRVGGFSVMNKEGEKQNLVSQNEFARFDPAKQTWENLPALPEGRSSHDAALIGNMLYVVGGWNMQGGGSDTVWHTTALVCNLDEETLAWKPIAAPTFARRALAVASWGGKLYCIGGMQEKGGTTTAVSIYDPQKDAWSEGPAVIGSNMDAFGSSAFAAHGGLYTTTMSGSLQRLAADGSKWEFVGQMAYPRFFHRLLTWNDETLVIVGGGSMTAGGKTLEVELFETGAVKTTAK